jgi:hypothetical protein
MQQLDTELAWVAAFWAQAGETPPRRPSPLPATSAPKPGTCEPL